MKKYFDNILFHLQISGGGSVHWAELMKRFNADPEVNFIEPEGNTDNILKKELRLKTSIKEGSLPKLLTRYFPLTIKIETPSIFHSSYYRYSLQKGVVNFTTVHDFIYEKFGRGIPKYVHHWQKGLAVKNADKIICVSNTTKKDLLQYFPDAAKKDIAVIHNGVSKDFVLLTDNQISSEFKKTESKRWVLYVGHRTHYKNFNFAAHVVAALPAVYHFAIVGNKLSDEEEIFLKKTVGYRYHAFGNVTNAELSQLYNTAECLLYPSSYEGFGIPIIEAFKCKCPVVALGTTIVEEIAGDAALKTNGLLLEGFTKNILSLQDLRLKKDLTEQGFVTASKFSWNRCFDETNKFYNTI